MSARHGITSGNFFSSAALFMPFGCFCARRKITSPPNEVAGSSHAPDIKVTANSAYASPGNAAKTPLGQGDDAMAARMIITPPTTIDERDGAVPNTNTPRSAYSVTGPIFDLPAYGRIVHEKPALGPTKLTIDLGAFSVHPVNSFTSMPSLVDIENGPAPKVVMDASPRYEDLIHSAYESIEDADGLEDTEPESESPETKVCVEVSERVNTFVEAAEVVMTSGEPDEVIVPQIEAAAYNEETLVNEPSEVVTENLQEVPKVEIKALVVELVAQENANTGIMNDSVEEFSPVETPVIPEPVVTETSIDDDPNGSKPALIDLSDIKIIESVEADTAPLSENDEKEPAAELEYIDEHGIPPEEQYNSGTNVSFFNPCSANLGYSTARLLQFRLSGIVSIQKNQKRR
jgi:hypothetical protein